MAAYQEVNSQLVKFNGQQFTSIGFSNEKIKGKMGTKRILHLHEAHKSLNNIAKRKNNSISKLNVSNATLKRGIKRIGKVVKGLPAIDNRVGVATLRHLRRIHVATRPIVKGGAAKKEEKK